MQWVLQDYDFGQNVQRYRCAAGLSQSQIVTKMQLLGSTISRSAFSKIERGRRNIKVSDLVALQRILGVEYSDILEPFTPSVSE